MSIKKIQISANTKKQELEQEQYATLQSSLYESVNTWVVSQQKLSLKEKVAFFRLVSTMLNSGIPLLQTIHILEKQARNPKLKYILGDIMGEMKLGKNISVALKKHSDDFEESEIGIIRSGEATGQLNNVFFMLAEQAEKSNKLSQQVKGALIYPSVIIVVVAFALILIMTYVIPDIKEMFEQFDAELPYPTQIVIAMSDFIVSEDPVFNLPYYLSIEIYLAILFIAYSGFSRSKFGKPVIDSMKLSIPLFGPMIQKVIIAKMMRGLSILLKSGLSIIKALEITANMVGSEVYKKRIYLIAEDLKLGISMTENMKNDEKHFPPLVVSMTGIGEQTANLTEISSKIAEYYESEVEEMVKGLMSILEPLIIVVVGATIGGIVVAIMLPILSLSDLAGG